MLFVKKIIRKYPILSCFVFAFISVLFLDTLVGEGLRLGTGLSYPASFNRVLGSLVFAELIAFFVTMLYVTFHSKKLQEKIIPWVLSGMVAVAVAFFFIGANDNNCIIFDPSRGVECGFFSINQQLHNTYHYHAWDRHDFLLESALPKVLKLQIPFVTALLLGYGIVHFRERKKS